VTPETFGVKKGKTRNTSGRDEREGITESDWRGGNKEVVFTGRDTWREDAEKKSASTGRASIKHSRKVCLRKGGEWLDTVEGVGGSQSRNGDLESRLVSKWKLVLGEGERYNWKGENGRQLSGVLEECCTTALLYIKGWGIILGVGEKGGRKDEPGGVRSGSHWSASSHGVLPKLSGGASNAEMYKRTIGKGGEDWPNHPGLERRPDGR